MGADPVVSWVLSLEGTKSDRHCKASTPALYSYKCQFAGHCFRAESEVISNLLLYGTKDFQSVTVKGHTRKCYQETWVLKSENLVRPCETVLCGMLLSQTSQRRMPKDDDDDDDDEVSVTG